MKGYRNIVEREIINHKKRSVLTILVIILGVSSLIFLSEIDALSKIYNMHSANYENGDKHFVFRNNTEEKLKKLENNFLVDSLGVSYEENVIVEKKLDDGEILNREEKTFYADEKYLNNILVEEYYSLTGRFPLNENEAVIVEKDRMVIDLGGKIKVDGKDRTVVGILENKIEKDNIKDRVLMGISTVANKKFMTHVRLKSNKDIVFNAEQIGNEIGITEKMHWYGDSREIDKLKEKETLDLNIRKINLYNQTVQIEGLEYKEVNANIILIALMGITLIFLTYISINATVKEKKKMYSILKCIGASNGQVRSLILKESIILALSSIIPGIILGEIIFLLLKPKMLFIFGNANFNMDYRLNLKILLTVAILVTVICMLASLKPMIWITKLSPVEGIKDENILSRKKRIRSKFIRKILGYEGEIAYKNLRASKGNFLGLTLVMILVLIIFNVFTSYYTYQVKEMRATFGVLDRDLSVEGKSKELKKILDNAKEYGEYSKFANVSNIMKIRGVSNNVIKDSTNFLYFNKEQNEIVSKGDPIITIINDKGFNDLKPYIQGINLTLENFKNDGAILFSNGEMGALNMPKEKEKIELQITDLEVYKTQFESDGNEVENKEIFKPNKIQNLDLNLIGTTYFENILGPRREYQWGFIGLIISEDTAKKLVFEEEEYFGDETMHFEFKSAELREKYISLLEGRLKGDIKENFFIHTVENTYERRVNEEAFLNTFATVMYSILGYVVAMMMICLINIRDIILNARKREFGIMFAVGMDKKMLRKCLIYEGIIQGGIALILGNAISITILQMIKMSELKFVYPKWILIVGSLVIVGVSAINTVNSIRRLSSDKAVEMIRNIE